MITFKKHLAYGVNENISKDLLYIKTFKLSGDEKEISKFLDNFSKIKKLYQFNITDRNSDYDYFFWCNVEKDKKDLSYITLEYNYNHSIVSIISEMVWLLWWLKGCKKSFNFNVDVMYDDIHNLVNEVDERLGVDTNLLKNLG